MKKQAVAASVTVYSVGDMTTQKRKTICDWLRKLADDLQHEPEAFAKTFRARYMYPANASRDLRGGSRVTVHADVGQEAVDE